MTRREAWLTAAGIFVVALVVRVGVASLLDFPKPEDTAYYVGVARNLVEGRGLVSDALWSFGTPPLVFPRPAFEVWLPLPALLAAIPVALAAGGRTPIELEAAMRAAQVVSVLAGALLAVLAWRLAADVAEERALNVGRARTLAIGTGLASAVYLPLLLHAALPDSTILFGVLVLAASLLMTRVLRDPRGARPTDARLIGIGLLLGAAALTRNEAVWLALAWAWLAWRSGGGRAERVRMVAVVAVVSLLVFAPWAVRNAAVFGNPLPGQAISNALSVTGFDIFAWNDPPTLSRYLAVGLPGLLEMRVVGIGHNLFNVLLLLGIPVALIGLVALPWQGRDRALRPVLLVSVVTFLVTSLLFPVATTWGTFLHAAAPVHVLLLISALGVLDAGLAALGRRLGWHRPVAWLGALLAVFASALFSVALLPGFAGGAAATERTYAVLERQLAAMGAPLDGSAPVIHDFPVWLAETARVPALALPAETPADVLDLAGHFGARWLIVAKADHGEWPAVLDGDDPASACFEEVLLPVPPDPADAQAIRDVRVFRIECGGVVGIDPAWVTVPVSAVRHSP